MNPYFNNLLIDCKLRPFSWVSKKAFINIQQLREKIPADNEVFLLF